MGRLLREEDVIKAMEDNSVMVEVFGKKRKMIDAMMMCCDIADMPTAYDVEAVVKELKELKRIEILGECPMESCSDCGTNCEGCYTIKAIEIVRKGGVK